jgi:hypothetical protein
MINLFRRKNTVLSSLILTFIKSKLPNGVFAYESSSNSKDYAVIITTKPKPLQIEYSIDENMPNGLSDGDKENLITTFVIPALEELNEDMKSNQLEIEKHLKRLKNE